MGFKDYITNQNVLLGSSAYSMGHRQNTRGPATKNGLFSFLQRLAFVFSSPIDIERMPLAADRASVDCNKGIQCADPEQAWVAQPQFKHTGA